MLTVVDKAGPAKGTIRVPADIKDPSKVLNIRSQLSPKLKEELIKFLKANLDVFA